ncbi:CaiB/BaiF CoA transferase family protein [Gordonia rubripertincta]|uniref:CoA transferase n=1 Tax=Gordonia rubripertincta TaxID=36822 RepID=A0ABT4MWP8_GORRU|nr:CoA transferase [Gordonia rubripertincta]MCZ4551438.1 CoA transferase [Gordonia rubripertincta]
MTGPHQPWLPLRGVRILDLTSMLPGGTATRLLVDLGAHVTKIEPLAGDPVRALHPRVEPDSSVQHRYLDGGKQSVRVDLKDPAGLERVRMLAAEADAVIESFRPGVAARLGVGYSDLSSMNSRLVYLSLSGYGQSGPRASSAGHDVNFVSLTGILGGSDRLPTVQVADVSGGMLAALGIVAGLREAQAEGVGRHLDVSLADSALFVAGLQTVATLAGDITDGDTAAAPLDGSSPCYRIYRARDGINVAVGALEPKFWARIAELVDRPDWVPRQFDPDLIPDVAELIGSQPGSHWKNVLERADTCVTVEQSAWEVSADEHFVGRGSVTSGAIDGVRTWRIGTPFQAVARAGSVHRSAIDQ